MVLSSSFFKFLLEYLWDFSNRRGGGNSLASASITAVLLIIRLINNSDSRSHPAACDEPIPGRLNYCL